MQMIPGGDFSSAKGQPGLVRAALFALCPRCGAPRRGLQPCAGCGLDFAAEAPSGRGLYLVVLPLVVVLVLAALKLDDACRPPLWVHALIWPPVVAAVIVGALRLVQVSHWRAVAPLQIGGGARAGGGETPSSATVVAPSGQTPPPPFGRSPSPKRGGEA